VDGSNRHRVAWRVVDRRKPEPAEPGDRLALQHQQLAVVGGGPNSPKKENYPAYVDRGNEESPRGFHALRVLDKKKDFTLDSLIAAAYDSYLPAFDVLDAERAFASTGLFTGRRRRRLHCRL